MEVGFFSPTTVKNTIVVMQKMVLSSEDVSCVQTIPEKEPKKNLWLPRFPENQSQLKRGDASKDP